MGVPVSDNKMNADHFEAVFAYATISILVTDTSARIISANPFALKKFGYSKKELFGKRIEILIPTRYHHKHRQHHKKFVQQPRTRFMGDGADMFAMKKSGKEFPVEISISNYTHEGNIFFIAFVNDISMRKKAQAQIIKLHNDLEAKVIRRTGELKKTLSQLGLTNDKLEESILFNKAILDNAGVMIIATDPEGIIRLFNPEASRNLGYEEAEVVGKKTPMIFHDRLQIAAKRRELLELYGIALQDDFDVMVEKAKRNILEELECNFVRKNGTIFPVSLTVTSVHNRKGTITGFMGVALDISQHKHAEEGLREALKKEKELNELKSGFVSMASHEFRTPLSTVLSSAYLIEKYHAAEDQPKREKHLERIVSSVNMLTDILNDFLSVGKIEEGKIPVRLTIFDISEWISTIIGEIRHIVKKQQKIRYKHEGEKEVLLDTSLLKHIIMNLVSNASKFSPEKSYIDIRTVKKDDMIKVSVKDHGIGISGEDQAHLMERFFRGANAGHIQGTGLGLHIVSKYAELMHGKVSCESETGSGTEFTITFTTK